MPGTTNLFLGRNIPNTSGSNNVFVGSGISALGTGSASWNTAVGAEAMAAVSTAGIGNSAYGFKSLGGLTTGVDNTAFGIRSGFSTAAHNSLTTGSRCTFLGADAKPNASTLINATAIGQNSVVDADNCIQLGNTLVTAGEDERNANRSWPGIDWHYAHHRWSEYH